MEADPGKQQQQPPHPSLPANYVSLALLQERRRLKLERQWREEEEEEARLRKGKEEGEARELLRKLKVEGEERERQEAQRRQTQCGTAQVAHRGRRRGPTRWSRMRGEAGAPTACPPEVVVLPNDGGAVVGVEDERGEGGHSGWRGRNGGPRRWGRRSGYGVASKSPNPEREPAAESAIGGEGGPLVAGRRLEVKPSPGHVEKERKEPPALESKLKERPRNVVPTPSFKAVEGAKEARKVLRSTARKGYRRAELSDTVEPDKIVEVGQKLKDLRSITKPEGDEVGILGKEDSVEHWPQRAKVGRRGRYPNFWADGMLGPGRRSRPASSGDNVMWVKKTEST